MIRATTAPAARATATLSAARTMSDVEGPARRQPTPVLPVGAIDRTRGLALPGQLLDLECHQRYEGGSQGFSA